ncbi:hypothetical protein Jiend_28410 [Micromonospora endophytica]|nr:hypothetical protein Jiend_28410 [Micromonospora endophytica]
MLPAVRSPLIAEFGAASQSGTASEFDWRRTRLGSTDRGHHSGGLDRHDPGDLARGVRQRRA